jgi:hypothetical protein
MAQHRLRVSRAISLDCAGLPGEGSIPVPFPPPPRRGRIFSAKVAERFKPNSGSDFSFELRTPSRQGALVFSERPIYLRSSGLRGFGTVLEIPTFRRAYECHEKRFCGSSWTGESIRFPIRHFQVRILRPQRASPVVSRHYCRLIPLLRTKCRLNDKGTHREYCSRA